MYGDIIRSRVTCPNKMFLRKINLHGTSTLVRRKTIESCHVPSDIFKMFTTDLFSLKRTKEGVGSFEDKI